MHEFECWFREHFQAAAPVGHCLRAEHHDRWLRLHSLPGSKRYAEDDAERAEVRHRAWTAASELLPTGSPVWLVVPRYDGHQAISTLALDFEDAGQYEHRLLEEAMVARASMTTWPHAGFDRLIDMVAKDDLRPVWFSVTNREAFAPYDGGVDLIAEGPARAEALRRVFPPAWFSRRADRL